MLNLTPHAIKILNADGDTTVVSPSGRVAKVTMAERIDHTVHLVAGSVGVPAITRTPDDVEGIQEDDFENHPDGVIVSSMVLDNLPPSLRQYNIYAPDTGASAIRNEKGQVDAVTRLVTPKI